MMEQPLVSVRVVTYNHEPWIAQCLEGILMQRTAFPVEAVVGDDGSTDGTRAIVADYARRFPDRICALLHDTHQGAQLNSHLVRQACRGKYLAMLEGDDYWIDPLKLQRQADFLEAHPEVSLCFHNALILNERLAATRLFFESPLQEILDFDDLHAQSLPTASLMARAEIPASQPEWMLNIRGGDRLFRLWCLHHGKAGYLDRIMSVYRRQAAGLDSVGRHVDPRAYYDGILFTLREFDKATGFVHTDSIRREIRRLRRDQRHLRLGPGYFLLHPGQGLLRIKEYAKWIRQKRRLFQ